MRLLRITAAFVSIGALAAGILLKGRLMGLGFAIGGWTGLSGYERQLRDAISDATLYWYWFALSQVAGGIVTSFAVTVRPGHPLRWAVWVPLFVVGFYVLTNVVFWTLVFAASTIAQLFGR